MCNYWKQPKSVLLDGFAAAPCFLCLMKVYYFFVAFALYSPVGFGALIVCQCHWKCAESVVIILQKWSNMHKNWL